MSGAELAASYDAVIAETAADDLKIGSTTIRVSDLVSRSPAFDGLYLYPPLLSACKQVIRQPFKLSRLIARTLRPINQPSNYTLISPLTRKAGPCSASSSQSTASLLKTEPPFFFPARKDWRPHLQIINPWLRALQPVP
ncbi:MAG TPA: hypothetical protein VKX25_05520 [Bryobacteraceae bacterium]|nr:hypothetical protein [Bryobacteraceae bacterium]